MIAPLLENKGNILDIFSKLLEHRIIFLEGEINSESACIIQGELLYLASISDEDISMYINSPGGEIYAGLGIIDTMNYVKPNINTICIGEALSMAAVILAVGNTRSILPNCTIMLHEPWGGLCGKTSDVFTESMELKRCKHNILKILSKNSKKSIHQLEKDLNKDFYINAHQALKYGIVDKIL